MGRRTNHERGVKGSSPPVAREYAALAYELLNRKTIDPAAELYTEVFLKDEPLTSRHGIDPLEFLPCAREYVRFCADKKLSYVARDVMTGTIAGFGFASDLTTDWGIVGPATVRLISLFKESMAIIAEVEQRCPALRAVQPGSVLHIFQGGVRQDYRGRRILGTIIRLILDRARNMEFKMVVGECTGPVSRHILQQAGFREAASVSYEEFEYDGRPFFAGIPGRLSLMIRDV